MSQLPCEGEPAVNPLTEPAGTGVHASRGEAEFTRQVAVSMQDRTIYREVLEILSGHYDLIVLRQVRDLPKNPAHQPGLILVDATALLTLNQAQMQPPVLALVDQTHLQSAGPLLAERVHDFLVSPYTATELLLRIRRVFRRFSPVSSREFTVGDFRIHLRTAEVYHGVRPLSLTRKEVALLYALARRMGATVTRDELLNEVWGAEYAGISNVLDVHIRSLRRKIELQPDQPRCIVTVRGIGYRFHGVAGTAQIPGRV